MSSLKTLRKILVAVVVVLAVLLVSYLVRFGPHFFSLLSVENAIYFSGTDIGTLIVMAVLFVLVVVLGIDIAIVSCVISDSKLW